MAFFSGDGDAARRLWRELENDEEDLRFPNEDSLLREEALDDTSRGCRAVLDDTSRGCRAELDDTSRGVSVEVRSSSCSFGRSPIRRKDGDRRRLVVSW